jgi:hypothetical protein
MDATPVAIGEAVAIYDYEATQPNQVSFKTGDILSIYKQEATGWWNGVVALTNQSGWFPASFVEFLSNTALTANAASVSVSAPHDTPLPPDDHAPVDTHALTDAAFDGQWEAYTTDENEVYYVNVKTGESRWTLPELELDEPPALPLDDPAPDGIRVDRPPSIHTHVDMPVSKSTDSGFTEQRSGVKSARGSVSTTFSRLSLHTKSSSPIDTVPPSKCAVTDDTGRFSYSNNFWVCFMAE